MPKLLWLLVFLPAAIVAKAFGISEIAIFASSALSILPLAKILGEATECLAERTGPRAGGLLNATFGNAAELIITLVAISAGKSELVKASITGSILGNLLLVLGFAMLVGGIKNGRQYFDRRQVDTDATMTVLALIAMSVPSLFSLYIPKASIVEELSLTTAALMVLLYALLVVYTLRSCNAERGRGDADDNGDHSGEDGGEKYNGENYNAENYNGEEYNGEDEGEKNSGEDTGKDKCARAAHPASRCSSKKALVAMSLSMAGIALMSEFLVGSVEAVTATLGMTEFFLGIIVVPIIGNVAEHLVAVQAARQNKMDLSLSIALGSSLQVALFVTPVLVFSSLLMGSALTLQFNQLELIALTAASVISALVSLDGESNWLEGAMLLAVYGILGLAFFFLPAGV